MVLTAKAEAQRIYSKEPGSGVRLFVFVKGFTYFVIKQYSMKILLEVNDNKADLLLELLKNVSFVKDARQIADNKITNPEILKSIEDFEKGRVQPRLCNFEDLKALIHA